MAGASLITWEHGSPGQVLKACLWACWGIEKARSFEAVPNPCLQMANFPLCPPRAPLGGASSLFLQTRQSY